MRLTQSSARRAAGAGLLLAAICIPIQIAGGADYPTVPPGLLILLAAALLMLFVAARWAVVVATVVTLFISFGAVAAASFREQLSEPGEAVVFVGSALQVLGLVTALISAVAAVREAFSRRTARSGAGRTS